MIGEHLSYHQALTNMETERRLEEVGGHRYLTRYSKEHKCYVLSVYEYKIPPSNSVVEHFQIEITSNTGRVRIQKKTLSFDDISSLLLHYESNRIDPALRSIGEAYTEEEYKKVEERKAKERAEQEQAQKEQADRERAEQAERERQERERRRQEERQRQRRERQEREQEERRRKEKEKQKCCNLL